MVDGALTQPTATTYEVSDLVDRVRAGRVRIPHFQRALRWQREDVRRLLDSILRGYPIGSLLLWARPAREAVLELGALTIEAPAFDEALWVVDGQQRLTSLACVLDDAGQADRRFAFSYDLEKRLFTASHTKREHLIPLPVLYDLQKLLSWFREHGESTEFLDEATRVAKLLRQFKVPAYIVRQSEERVLRDIFDRMNNYGKRLSRAEVFAALHESHDGPHRPRTFSDIGDHIDATFGFGSIDNDTILRAFLARRGPDVTREIRNEFKPEGAHRDFPDETSNEAHHHTQSALERVVRFLQEEAGVPHLGFLPYRYLIVVLTRFFAHHAQPSRRNRRLLRRWFWRAAVVGPAVARSSYTSTMRKLAACVDPDSETASTTRLLDATRDFPTPTTSTSRFHATTAEVRFSLCALWALHPRSWQSGEVYTQEDLADALDRATTASAALGLFDAKAAQAHTRIGNRLFLMGDDDSSHVEARLEGAGASPSHDLIAILRSHAVGRKTARLWDSADREAFINARTQEIETVTQGFLEGMLESTFEDTPPLADLILDDEPSSVSAPHDRS